MLVILRVKLRSPHLQSKCFTREDVCPHHALLFFFFFARLKHTSKYAWGLQSSSKKCISFLVISSTNTMMHVHMIFRHTHTGIMGPGVSIVEDQQIPMLLPYCWPSMVDSAFLQNPCELHSLTLWMENIFYKTFNWSHILTRKTFYRIQFIWDPCVQESHYLSKECIHVQGPMLPYQTSGYPPNDSIGC